MTGDPDLVELAEVIRTARRSKQLTQERLAELSGLHITYIAGIEGGRRNPTYRTLRKIATALEMTVSELLAGIGLP